MEEVRLTAQDISCDHCINAIKKAVGGLAGVRSVEGDPETKEVRVIYDPGKASLDDIEHAMEEEGYPVSART